MAIIGICATAPAVAQSAYAVFSPAILAPGAGDSAEGRKFVQSAESELADPPHPKAELQTAGLLPHQGIRDQSLEAEKDFQKMLDFAFAYRLTGERKYLDADANYLQAWSGTYRISLRPIDETHFSEVMLALDLTRADLPPDITAQSVALFHAMSAGYVQWIEKNGNSDKHNWTSHRLKLAVLGAYLSGDAALIARAGKAFRQHLRVNIRKDGSVEDFYQRDALHYVVYDLEPLVTAALAAKEHGEDWFHTASTGRPSLEMAVDWLAPFATSDKTHQEFGHSSVHFDAARDKAGEKGYSGTWDPGTSVTLLALAAWEDPRFRVLLGGVEAATGKKPAGWAAIGIRVDPQSVEH